MSGGIGDPTAIVGIGVTEFSKDSERSELRLAVECITALDDCGLTPADVSGLAGFCMDTNLEIEIANNRPRLTEASGLAARRRSPRNSSGCVGRTPSHAGKRNSKGHLGFLRGRDRPATEALVR